MQRRHIILLVVGIGLALLIAKPLWYRYGVDWAALYEQKLGQPIKQINEAPLVAKLEAESWGPARITDAHLEDGSMLLLGLPSGRFFSSEDVVDQTVVLRLDDAKERCQEALGKEMNVWQWESSIDEATNRFVLWSASFVGVPSRTAIDPSKEPHCELVFYDEWQLEIVHRIGVIGAAP
ncbi:MAG TPA: hypothetical protein VGD58_17460 [Herpetosiphonaceae bacterium]